MKKPRILTLGWEFPPLMAGGLGVACQGLTTSLAEFVDTVVMVPKAEPYNRSLKYTLIGVNRFVPGEWKFKFPHLDELLKHVYTTNETFFPFQQKPGMPFSPQNLRNDIGMFENLKAPYDGNLMDNVNRFAGLVTLAAAGMHFDVIHAHDWMTIPAAISLKLITGKPLVLHVHSLETDRAGNFGNPYIYDLERRGMELADAVIPVSHYTGEIVERKYHIDPRKIVPVHNAIEHLQSFQKPLEGRPKTVVFLGRITYQKGPEYFVKMAKTVLSLNPQTTFVMAGTGDKTNEMKQLVHRMRMGQNFHFTGHIKKEDVFRLLANARVYVMPSVSEPFGLSALEAAKLNVPCIISKQSGVAEVLHSALQVDYWDTDLMASYVHSLLNDLNISRKIVASQNHDMENIHWDNAALEVIRVYKRMLSQN